MRVVMKCSVVSFVARGWHRNVPLCVGVHASGGVLNRDLVQRLVAKTSDHPYRRPGCRGQPVSRGGYFHLLQVCGSQGFLQR